MYTGGTREKVKENTAPGRPCNVGAADPRAGISCCRKYFFQRVLFCNFSFTFGRTSSDPLGSMHVYIDQTRLAEDLVRGGEGPQLQRAVICVGRQTLTFRH